MRHRHGIISPVVQRSLRQDIRPSNVSRLKGSSMVDYGGQFRRISLRLVNLEQLKVHSRQHSSRLGGNIQILRSVVTKRGLTAARIMHYEIRRLRLPK